MSGQVSNQPSFGDDILYQKKKGNEKIDGRENSRCVFNPTAEGDAGK